MSLSESLGAGDTEAPAELVVPDYGAPAVSADKGPTSMGSEPAPAPAAAASGTAGGLAGLCATWWPRKPPRRLPLVVWEECLSWS